MLVAFAPSVAVAIVVVVSAALLALLVDVAFAFPLPKSEIALEDALVVVAVSGEKFLADQSREMDACRCSKSFK